MYRIRHFLKKPQPSGLVFKENIGVQLPVYKPSQPEREDPRLYAQNVRQMLMKAGGFGSSDADLMDCRAYIRLLQGRKPSMRSRAGKAWEEKYGSQKGRKL